MIPDYCSECINRQNQATNMPYMQPMMQQPMMQGGYQSPMQMPLSQQPMQQPQFSTQPMQQMGFQQGTPGLSALDMSAEDGTIETNINYTQGYLRTKIGARVKIEFLIGTNMLIDREGTLTQVGISYVIIREIDTDDDLLCDIYSIKFVRFYY